MKRRAGWVWWGGRANRLARVSDFKSKRKNPLPNGHSIDSWSPGIDEASGRI